MKKSTGFDVEFWSERLNLPYVANNWYHYNLYRTPDTIYRHHEHKKMSRIRNVHRNHLHQKLHVILPAILDENWQKCQSLYTGLIAFLLKRCKDDITYFKHRGRKDNVSVVKCCQKLHFPHWAKENLNKIFERDFCFEDFLHGFDDVEELNFDIEAATWVVRAQGDDAIFSVLMQLFNVGKYITNNTANLVPSLPMVWTPEVSPLVNHTGFPVVATKFSDKFEWNWTSNGCFLLDEHLNVIDCACVGRFNVFKEKLANRLSFLGRSGLVPRYVICHTWDELFDAVGLYGGDLLVRNMSSGFDDWYKFGPNACVVAETSQKLIFGRDEKHHAGITLDLNTGFPTRELRVINLKKQAVDIEVPEEPVWNNEELKLWFEIGRICKKKIEEFST